MPDLHKMLVDKQETAELLRKRIKAMRRGYWTQEDIDYSERAGEEMMVFFEGKHA